MLLDDRRRTLRNLVDDSNTQLVKIAYYKILRAKLIPDQHILNLHGACKEVNLMLTRKLHLLVHFGPCGMVFGILLEIIGCRG